MKTAQLIKYLIPAASLVLAFLLGVGYGKWTAQQERWSKFPWEAHTAAKLDHYTRELNLSPEQVSKMQEILERKRERFMEMRKKMRPQFKQLQHDTREEIKSILEPPQQEKFDEMVKRWKARRGHFGRHGPRRQEY